MIYMLPSGLYEQIINKLLRGKLVHEGDRLIQTASLDKEEAPRILAKYLAEVIENGLHNLKDHGQVLEAQLDLANKLIDTLVQGVGEPSLSEQAIDPEGEMLLALIDRKNNVNALDEKAEIQRPVTSLAESSLFTGAVHEPSLYTELKLEIVSCDRIDMLVSFIKWSGLRLIIEELRRFTEAGGKLRVITTSYMGATDLKAIEELRELSNTEIKISYDTKRTRLHAKAYLFYRHTGFSTAYIGSSNLSNAALSSGLEWNVKATAKDLPDTLAKIEATFESYWHAKEFEVFTSGASERLAKALKSERYSGKDELNPYLFDITPFSYQQEILDRLDVERKVRGYYRNLIVAATGTGKTVISAFDYLRFRKENKGKPCRLLFVAHREEILKQSLACFRGVLKDGNFGDLYVGNYKPESLDHLFISIQTFNFRELDRYTTPDFYDFIIVDEFHHAAALSYQKLLS